MESGGETPPPDLSSPLQALWWLKKGGLKIGAEWTKAHEICQSDEGNRPYDLVHALAHLIEGDTSNAAYWYRRAGETPAANIPTEWQRIASLLTAR